MFDARVRRWIDPGLDRLGRGLAARGVTANAVTLVGLGVGLAAAGAVAFGQMAVALGLMALSRLADGLDGAVARATRATAFGGYLDICCDFAFYGAVPLGFVLLDPAANGVAGAVLLVAFYVNGATFLGFAVLAAQRGGAPGGQANKSLHYSVGLLEGSETIAFFVVLILWPGAFVPLALGFAAACFLTAGLRIALAAQVFGAVSRP